MTNRPIDFTAPMGGFEEWNLTRPVILHHVRELARALTVDALDGAGQLGGLAAGHALNLAVPMLEGRVGPNATDIILERIAVLAATLDTHNDEQRATVRAIIAAIDPTMEAAR